MANFYKNILGKITGFSVLLVLLLFASQSAVAAPISGSLTIDKSSAASATNYISFQSLFTALASNGVNGAVTVTVLNGPYTEQVKADAISGVSATNTITIDGNGQTLQFSATASANRHTLRFNGADRVYIKNLTIRATGSTYAWGVHFMNASEYNTLDNCTIINASSNTTQANNVGINFCNSTSSVTTLSNAAKYCTVKNCTITGNGGSTGPHTGINVAAQGQNVDAFIKLENNIIQNFYSFGIRLYYASAINIMYNDISRPNRTNSTTAYGMELYYYCYRDTVVGNRIHNCYSSLTTYTGAFYGIRAYYNYDGVVASNAIYNNENMGVQYNMYYYYPYAMTISNNTISCDITATHNSTIYGIYLYSYTTLMAGTSVVNNIISMTRPGSGSRYAYYYYANIPVINNNVYSLSGATNVRFSTGLTVANSLADWQNATPHDDDAVDAYPKYKDIAAGDVTPTVVQLDGQGVAVASVTRDIFGNLINTTNPDPGAAAFDIDANATRFVLAGNNNCQAQKETIKMWVRNNSPYSQEKFNVTYRINGGTEVVAPFSGTLPAGDSVLFSFPTPHEYTSAGAYNFEGRIKGKSFVGPYTVNVNAAPLGAEVVKGSGFNGQFFSGNVLDPDIVANPDMVEYELKAPTGYDNKDYGTTWYISKFVAKTVNEGALNSADTAHTNAGLLQNFKFRYTPSSSFTDSTVRLILTVYSLTTNCYAPDIERAIFVAPRPVAGNNVVDLCDGETKTFSSTSTISSGTMSYDWDFGDLTTSNFANNEKLYATHGTYTVKLTVTSNYGYSDVISKTINVHRKPEVDFTQVNACEGKAIDFTDNTVIYNGPANYEWNFGDNAGTSAIANPSYNYTSVGVYMTKLTVTDAKGCMQTITKPVTYSKNPLADFTFPATVCNQADVQFINNSTPAGNTGYTWKFGDGNTANSFSPAHSYATAGTYPVTIIARNDFNCADSITKTVTLNESPAVNYTVSSQCIGEAVSFTNTTTEPAGSTVVYNWHFGDGATSNAKDDQHTYMSVGSYEVVLLAAASNGCVAEKRDMVSFGEKPLVGFAIKERACVNDQVALTNTSFGSQSALTYDWNLDDGNTSTLASPNVTYTTPGVKTVKLTVVSVQGCGDSVSKTITVTQTPNSDFTFESGKTGDGRILFTPFSAGLTNATYRWVYGDGSVGNAKTQHDYVYFGLGIFKASLQITENGCGSSTTKEIVLNTMSANEHSGEGKFSIYPNPTADEFTVNLIAAANVTGIEVYSVLGARVHTQSVAQGQNNIVVNLGEENAGVYLVKVITTDGTYSSQMLLNR